MQEFIAVLFDPSDPQINWPLNVAMLIVGSYLIVWLFAFVLCRLWPLGEGGIIVNIYSLWLFPMTIHSVLFAGLLLVSAKYYSDLGISLWYCMAFFFPVILSGGFGVDLSRKVQGRVLWQRSLARKGGAR